LLSAKLITSMRSRCKIVSRIHYCRTPLRTSDALMESRREGALEETPASAALA
jgi:hypothetical protein